MQCGPLSRLRRALLNVGAAVLSGESETDSHNTPLSFSGLTLILFQTPKARAWSQSSYSLDGPKTISNRKGYSLDLPERGFLQHTRTWIETVSPTEPWFHKSRVAKHIPALLNLLESLDLSIVPSPSSEKKSSCHPPLP